MLTRIVSGAVGIGIWLLICFGGLALFTLGVTVLAAFSIQELVTAYRTLLSRSPDAASTVSRDWWNPAIAWCGLAAPTACAGIAVRYPHLLAPLVASMVGVVLLLSLLLGRYCMTGCALGPWQRQYGLIGYAYAGTLYGSLVLLRALPGQIRVPPFGLADRGAWIVLFVAVCVWANDSFAFFVGKRFGRRKLAPSLSPGKTVEGFLGGLIGSVAAGSLFSLWIGFPVTPGIVVGLLAGLVGPVGDLFESCLKREIDIKDFGSAMPGHGGALDRFDSLLFVAPMAYLYLAYLSPAAPLLPHFR